MDSFKLKGLLILAVLIVGTLFAAPSFFGSKEVPEGWIGPKEKIRLGLDLQGGIHLVLRVVTDKAVESRLNSVASDLKSQMINERIHYSSVSAESPEILQVVLRVPDDYAKLGKLITDSYPYLREANRSTAGGTMTVNYQISADEASTIRTQAVEQALETVRNRIDQFGVSEPSIIPQGNDRIVLQLPGVTDPERAKALLKNTAILEFKLVDEERSVQDALRGDTPSGSYVAYMKDGNQPILLKQRAVMTGDLLDDARVRIQSTYNQPYVEISFSRQGGRIFERVTSENVGKRLAILLDGKVYSAPVIREAIAGGRAIIEGNFTDEEASDLAIILRAGSLPAPVDILEERTVGPSLGQDSIYQGFLSIIIGGLAVVVFMLIYYKFSGLITDLALIANIVLILGALAVLGATLTLPGLGGIVLTIGMAVDANVLVYERIKEELRLGRTAKMAVEAGYKNALPAILDANITTLIAAIVLFQFGTGPVQGFAVTLSIGIVASLFTALVLCRWIQEWLVNYQKIERISI
ncbi:MAG TPA: protein translocase subunit SecD [Deltaproteobacteria bacterium]|jgi:preprotein translocase subunit SecD|nr:protein translocase subunit SecD [Deltaproteobacteria bacterium]HQQ16566.1 protein translocase subunit SecD [Deltaproteobacteria bacterium]